MASFRVKCPSCEALVPIRDEGMIGRKIDCPKCKYRFVVEEPEETPPTESAAEEEAPAKTETKIKAAKNKVSKSAVTAKAKVKAGLKEANPDDEVADTAVTTKTKGKAGPKKTDPDEADEDAPAKKPAKKGPSMLVIGGGLGGVAVVALGVALYFFLSGPSKPANQQAKNPPPAGPGTEKQAPKDPKDNKDPKGNDPKNNKDPKDKDPKDKDPKDKDPKDKPQGSGPQVALSDITNLLPNDTRAVINLSVDNLRRSSINTAMLKTAGAFNAKAFLQTFGFPIEEVSQVVMAFNDAQRWTFCVVRTSKPVKQEDLISRLNASAEAPIKLHAYYLVKRDLDPLGNFLLRNPEGNYFLKGETRTSQFAMHILDPQTLVFADFEPMKKFLEDDRKPAVVFQPPTTTPVVPSTPPAGTPPTPGQPPTGMGPGGQQRPPLPGGTPPTPPTGMGPGVQQQPGGMGPGGQQRPPYPGGNSPPGQPPTGMGPGGQQRPPNPTGGGAGAGGVPPTGQTPGGVPPNGKPGTETPPAPVAPVPAPPVVPSWITIKPEMKSVLDSVEKGDKPVIISFAGDIHFLLGLFGQMREQVAANKLDINYVLGFIGRMRELMDANKEKGSLDIAALKNLEDFNLQMEDLFKAAAVSILSFREDRLIMAAAVEGNGEKGVERVRELYKWLNSPEEPPANSTRPNQPGGFSGQPGSMAGYPGGQTGMPLTPQGPSIGGMSGNPSGPYPGQPGTSSSGGMQGYPGGNTGSPPSPGGGKLRPAMPSAGSGGSSPPPGGPGGFPPPGGPGGFPPTGGPGTGLPGTGKPTPPVKTHSGDWVVTIANGTLTGKLTRGIRIDDYNRAMTTLEKAMVVLRGESDMVNSRPRIHELAAALQRYVKAKGNFPPGTLNRTESAELLLPLPPQKRLSWMVDLLPFLASGEFKTLPFDHDKTWSEGQNGMLARLVIPQYVVRGSKPELPYRIKYPGTSEMFAATHYVGIAGVGLDAAYYQENDAAASKRIGIFGYDRFTKPADIKDGPEQTIALLMVPVDHKSPWIAGGGSTVRGVSEELDCFKPFVCAEYNGKKGSYAIMADGKVRFIAESIAPETFRALCTINGGEKIDNLNTIAPEIFPDVTSTELKTADVVLPAGGDKKPAESAPAAPTPTKAEAQENLDTLIPEMIRLIEAKEYGKLLRTAALPEELEQMVKREGSLDKVVERFVQDPNTVASLLKVLREIQTAKPTLSDEGKTATYKHSVPLPNKKDTIVFVRIGKLWYVKN